MLVLSGATWSAAAANVLSLYWTQEHYDIVTAVEAPDDQTAMAALLAAGGQGNVRTEILRAFVETEMASILQKV